jgi:hypothetical protein
MVGPFQESRCSKRNTYRCYGTNTVSLRFVGRHIMASAGRRPTEAAMQGIIYLVGLVVVILAILSFFGLR